MKLTSTTFAPSLTVIALAVALITGFSVIQPSHSADELAPRVVQAQPLVKQENISQDYAKAHQKLMEKPDEPPVNAF